MPSHVETAPRGPRIRRDPHLEAKLRPVRAATIDLARPFPLANDRVDIGEQGSAQDCRRDLHDGHPDELRWIVAHGPPEGRVGVGDAPIAVDDDEPVGRLVDREDEPSGKLQLVVALVLGDRTRTLEPEDAVRSPDAGGPEREHLEADDRRHRDTVAHEEAPTSRTFTQPATGSTTAIVRVIRRVSWPASPRSRIRA